MEKRSLILVVDDTPENITILSEHLNDYRVKFALTGKKAISIAESEQKPDLILLDILMPEMDGYEVCRILKSKPETKDIPVIFLSAMTDISDKIKGFQVGAVDYITKPFQGEEVQARVKTHVTLNLLQSRLKNINKELEDKVTERTSELLIAKNKAEESNRIKSYFLALMQHELRTPMNGILGLAKLLSAEIEDERHNKLANIIHDSAIRLHNTLDSILTTSTIESGKLRASLVKIEIIAKTKKLFEIHKVNANSKGLELIFYSDLNSLNIMADEIMYESIFNNIVDNSIKYSNKGNITVHIYTENQNDSDFFCLKISDQGNGIPIEKQTIIFEEFRQVNEGTNREFEGLGLGLSQVRKYVELMNGIIDLDSEPAKGTVFIIKLPIIN